MTPNERLERIKAKCKERDGWEFHTIGTPRMDSWWKGISYIEIHVTRPSNPVLVRLRFPVGSIDLAEALLAATDAGGPVIVIELDCYDCALDPIHCGMSQGVSPESGEGSHIPGPNCPGPGPKRLVPVDGGEV